VRTQMCSRLPLRYSRPVQPVRKFPVAGSSRRIPRRPVNV